MSEGVSLGTVRQESKQDLPEHERGSADEVGNVKVKHSRSRVLNRQLLHSQIGERLEVNGELAAERGREVLGLQRHILKREGLSGNARIRSKKSSNSSSDRRSTRPS